MAVSSLRVLALASIKGGVGKTGSAVSIAGVMAENNDPDINVLLIDVDPQGSSSKFLGMDSPSKYELGMYDLFANPKETSLMDVIQQVELPKAGLFDMRRAKDQGLKPPTRKNLYVAPADMRLKTYQFQLYTEGGDRVTEANFILRDKIEEFRKQAKGNWFIIIDTKPDYDTFTIGALMAADKVMIPVTPSEFALDGFRYLLSGINSIATKWNTKLQVIGVFRSMWKNEERESTQYIQDELDHFTQSMGSNILMNTVIRSSNSMDYALRERLPINYFRRGISPITPGFKMLVEEMEERWKSGYKGMRAM
jgi:chromosome partitioning protein